MGPLFGTCILSPFCNLRFKGGWKILEIFGPVLLTTFAISEYLINDAWRSCKSANLACFQKGVTYLIIIEKSTFKYTETFNP
jgi:hypothetical protein